MNDKHESGHIQYAVAFASIALVDRVRSSSEVSSYIELDIANDLRMTAEPVLYSRRSRKRRSIHST